MGIPFDLRGQKFNRLTAIDSYQKRVRNRSHVVWRCQCECGNRHEVTTDQLRSGGVKSCGCLRRERTSQANTKHGKSGTRIYSIWIQMLARCTKPRSTMYPSYGARGIRVCERWSTSFDAFLQDMGEPPTPKHSIDRIDNNGHYEPGNCRWADPKTQGNNARHNRIIEFRGESMTLSQWAERVGMRYQLIQARLSRLGWTVERALTEQPSPIRQAGQSRRSRIDRCNLYRSTRHGSYH